MAIADTIYDFILQDAESNPTVELGLVLAEEDEKNRTKRWREFRVPPIPPRQSQGPLSFTHKDPIADFVFAQSSWHEGAYQPYYNDNDPSRYAETSGVDASHEGVLALGQRRGALRSSGTTVKSKLQSNIFMVNGDWEEGQVVGWAAGTGVTATADTTTIKSGIYSGKLVVAQSTAAGTVISQTLANPTIYRSREITVIAYIRRDAGSDSGVFLRLTDSAGGPTDSPAVTTAAWTYVSVTRTIDSGASSITISIEHNATTTNSSHTFYQDDCYVIPTGGITSVGAAIRGSTTPDEAYVALGRCVLKWNESTFVWDAVYIDSTNPVTDIIDFNDRIYVAFGESNGATPRQYIYGTGTSWTTAALNATTTHQDNHARYWVKARTGAGEWVLWKAGPSTNQGTERHTINWSSDPTVNWFLTTAFTVGDSDKHITGLHAWRDTFVVSKVNGLWVWDGGLNDFSTLTPEWEHIIDEENGSVGQTWGNDLYVNTVRQGFFRLSGPSEPQDLSRLLSSPRLPDLGGRITAMAADARHLVLGLDTPTADTTTTKTSKLVKLDLGLDKRFHLHTVSTPAMALIDTIFSHRSDRLWVFGRTFDSNLNDYIPAANAFIEPSKTVASFADATPSIEYTGTFDTSIWHGNLPETDKAMIALTIWCEDLDTEHTIQVDFGREGRLVSTTRLGTFNSSARIQTLFFKDISNPKEEAVGRFFQLRFTFATDDTVSPKMYAFALHTQLAPDRIRAWDLYCKVSDTTSLLSTGFQTPESKADLEFKLDELERQVFPLTLREDFTGSRLGSGEGGEVIHQVRLVDYYRVPEDDVEDLWWIRLQEVPTVRANG